MTNIMMALGDFRFGLDTAAYDQLTRSDTYRWQTQNRLGRKPSQQYLGEGETTIEFSGFILPHFKGGLGQIDAMRTEAGKGEKLRMVDSKGINRGHFVIKRINETQSQPISTGQPRRIEFSIELADYGDDAGAET